MNNSAPAGIVQATKSLRMQYELALAELDAMETKLRTDMQRRFPGSSCPSSLLDRLQSIRQEAPQLQEQAKSVCERKEAALISMQNLLITNKYLQQKIEALARERGLGVQALPFDLADEAIASLSQHLVQNCLAIPQS